MSGGVPRRERPHDARSILVTGGCGFIGSNLVRHVLATAPDATVVNVDALTYAGNPANLRDLDGHPRYRFVRADIRDAAKLEPVFGGRACPDVAPPDAVVHLAAETHVDRSIVGPQVFVETNVQGTLNLLEQARARGLRYLQISTDEVYGDLRPQDPAFDEEHPLRPSSPYSASKAGADLLVLAYARTYGLDASIVRASNNYGPYQFPEKLIPLMAIRAARGEPLPVYGDGANVRDWLHVEDHCRAIMCALGRGRPGAVYHAGGGCERRNLDIVHDIVRILGAREDQITLVKDRPGHDRRYALDYRRTRAEIGWEPRRSFEESLAETVRWYQEHEDWWAPIVSGEYRRWIDLWYGDRT